MRSLLLLLLAASTARADAFTVLWSTVSGGPGYLWEYAIVVAPGTQVETGDSFTIFDARGVLSAGGVTGWCTTRAVNITFTYCASNPLGAGTYFPFTIASVYGADLRVFNPSVPWSTWGHSGSWSGVATTAQSGAKVAVGGSLFAPGPTIVITSPDPSTFLLLGTGLLGLLVFRRRPV